LSEPFVIRMGIGGDGDGGVVGEGGIVDAGRDAVLSLEVG
jgi:hypothetical protein